jgi:peptide/nickel transport system substrate-binding protein
MRNLGGSNSDGDVESVGITRREAVVRGAYGAALLGAGSLLAGCGSSSVSSGTKAKGAGLPSSSGGGTPVRGGTLTLGAISGGPLETLNPLGALTNVDELRAFQIFDRLFLPTEDLRSVVPQLALSAEPNKDATVWTLRLRPDVTWHDGKPFTADDVLYTFNFWTNPLGGQTSIANLIDLKRMRKRGPLVVEIPLVAADSLWPTTLTTAGSPVVQADTNFKALGTHAIGTGPFKVKSFSPGRQSVFVANGDYWQHGKPYIDTLVINSSFTDESSRVNALLDGLVEAVPLAGYIQARQQLTNPAVKVFGSSSPQTFVLVMRVDKGPLADPRVRQAMKLLVDRPALISGALAGFGSPGNDLLATGAKYYDYGLRSRHDPEQAKALLKAAGMEGATFTLQTTDAQAGFVQSASLFAQQASAAGITVNVDQISPTTYDTTSGGFLVSPFRSSYYFPYGSLDAAYMSFFAKTSTLNETHWGSQAGGAAWDKLLSEARAATDPARAAELWAEVQKAQFTDGGLLVWANADYVDLAAPHVKGLTESAAGYLNNGSILNAWLEAK